MDYIVIDNFFKDVDYVRKAILSKEQDFYKSIEIGRAHV